MLYFERFIFLRMGLMSWTDFDKHMLALIGTDMLQWDRLVVVGQT